MDVRSAIISMINGIPGTWPVASAYLGMNETALKNRAYELKGQAVRTHDALRLQDFSGSTLFAEAIAIASGGTFVKLPAVGHIGNEQITDKFHEIFEELGQLSAEFRAFTADGEIDGKEQEQLNETVDKMHRTMDELRALTFKVYCHETAESMRAKRGGK